MDRFTFDPTYSTAGIYEVRTNRVTFGDGYEQRAEDGINAARLSYDMRFNSITQAKAAALTAFLRAHGSTVAFIWTPPPPAAQVPLAFILRMPVNTTHRGFDNIDIAFKMDQDFNPATRCEAVVITAPGNMITMVTATAGAVIRYTSDGSIPTETTGTPYVAPFAGVDSTDYTAIAIKTDKLPSVPTVFNFSL